MWVPSNLNSTANASSPTYTASRSHSASNISSYQAESICQMASQPSKTSPESSNGGLMGGTIHAFAWDEPGRHTVIDHARQQLPSGSTHRPV